MKLVIENACIEGIDLAGKTTLYTNIHKRTGWRYNIQDRGVLSMLVYASLNRRNTAVHERHLEVYLKNLNNIIVVLQPKWETIEERYNARGDEEQDLESLKKLHKLFEVVVSKIKDAPNVFLIDEDEESKMTFQACQFIKRYENNFGENCASHVHELVTASTKNELQGVEWHTEFKSSDIDFMSMQCSGILRDPDEGEYYKRILTELFTNIDDEMQGKGNGVAQKVVTSRRFIYTDDSCISLIHGQCREGSTDMNIRIVCRSTNVTKTLPLDAKFFVLACGKFIQMLDPGMNRVVRLHVTLNSAHLIA